MMHRTGHLVLIGLGGAAGATVRWLIGQSINVDGFPWHTLLVNVTGCALLAAITTSGRPLRNKRLLGAGFCGGLTTLSTLSVEVVELLDQNNVATAFVYLLTSLALGLAAYVGVRRFTIGPPDAGEGA